MLKGLKEYLEALACLRSACCSLGCKRPVFAKWIVALTALMSGKRHLDKGVAGAGRPPSLLVVAISSVKSL